MMAVGIDSRSSDLLEDVVIDPFRISVFRVPPPARRFSDAVADPMMPLGGLNNLGPYDVNTTDRHLKRDFNSCEIIGAYPRGDDDTRNDLAELFSFVDQGYPGTRGDFDVAFDSFSGVFRLGNATFHRPDEFLPYDLDDLGGFEGEVLRAAEEAKARGSRPLVLVAVHSHRTIAAGREIYVPLKRLLNRRGVPSQFLSEYPEDHPELGILSQVRRNWAVGWSVWNVALAIYTKLGGVPWAVTQHGKTDEHIDITIGLRFARVKQEKGGFCLGIATVLDRFGRLIGTVPLEDAEYHRAADTPIWGMTLSDQSARRLVTGALDNVLLDPRTQAIIQARKPLSIVFHKLGPGMFHQDEIEGIRGAIGDKLPDHDVWVGFVPIVSGETLAAFGPPSKARVLPEGSCIGLNENTALLYTIASERKFHAPITVKLQNLGESDCAFESIEPACVHALTLCGLHWQTVVAGKVKLPADLHFAASIAQGFADDVHPRPGSWLWKTQWYL